MHLTGTTFQPHVGTLNRANIFHGVGCALVHLTQHFHGQKMQAGALVFIQCLAWTYLLLTKVGAGFKTSGSRRTKRWFAVNGMIWFNGGTSMVNTSSRLWTLVETMKLATWARLSMRKQRNLIQLQWTCRRLSFNQMTRSEGQGRLHHKLRVSRYQLYRTRRWRKF